MVTEHSGLRPLEEDRRDAVVLVHGAWVGEWSWLPVLPLLTASGRAVHAVSLTGHGARRHQSGPHVRLGDHVDDVVNLVETFDLTNVTLVGHSYGGRVITQASLRLRDRLAALVYLDAHTPVADDPGQPPARIELAERNGGMLPFATEYTPDERVFGKGGIEWFNERVMPQSFACFADEWTAELPDELGKTFVYASGYSPSRFSAYAEICRDAPDWAYHDLDGPHFLMLSHPTEVTRIILDAAL